MANRETKLTNQSPGTNNQPVALRTRRLSGTLAQAPCLARASSMEAASGRRTGVNVGEISAPQPATNASETLGAGGQAKHPRLHRRRDYNELANGHEYALNGQIKLVARAHEKAKGERSEADNLLLEEQAHLLPAAIVYLKRKQEKRLLKERLVETEESAGVLRHKANQLAELISQSSHVVVYTGAGISTSASIPDYRGPNGLWTQIRRTGSFSMTRVFKDLSKAEPTLTHMAIGELCRRQMVEHVVSQNFDGLHLRSGVAPAQLSEIHGNMFIEVCPSCERQYFRQADVTQRTVRFRHKTGRQCHECEEPNNNLMDTIVLYGERSRSRWPMNWERASKAAKNADLIICLGSSLKTLRRYGCLWPKSITNGATSKQRTSETKLVIVNLQHTSKDKHAVLKISGKCDLVMAQVMRKLKLQVPKYEPCSDPLRGLAVPFSGAELAQLDRDLIFATKQVAYERRASSVRDGAKAAQNEDSDRDTSAAAAQQKADLACALKRPRTQLELGPNGVGSCKLELAVGCGGDDDEERCSPSLFVSELTDDPDKRRLRMRIRALTPSEV